MTNYRMCVICLAGWLRNPDTLEPGDKVEIVPPAQGCDAGECE